MRPAFLGCGVSNVDRSSLTPQCLVSLCRRMDFCTKPPAQGPSGRGGAVLVFAPPSTAAGSGRFGNHPRLPARHGQRRQPVCRGFQGAFLFGAGCGILLLAVVGRLAAAPVCWRTELEGGQQQGWTTTAKPQPGQPTGARPRRTAKPGAETSPDLPAAQEQAGDPSATGESTRRNYAAGGTWRTAPAPGPPPPRLPGATDGNHGESTGSRGGGG